MSQEITITLLLECALMILGAITALGNVIEAARAAYIQQHGVKEAIFLKDGFYITCYDSGDYKSYFTNVGGYEIEITRQYREFMTVNAILKEFLEDEKKNSRDTKEYLAKCEKEILLVEEYFTQQ